MKISLTFFVIVCFSQALAVPFSFDKAENVIRSTKDGADTSLCRLFKGASRCVDEPLKVMDKEPWCPYRMCAQSYVPAELCPADLELQATDKCRVEEITRDIYKCDGKAFGHTYVPIGCTKETPGCEYLPTCSCVKVEGFTSKVFTQIAPFKPDCTRGETPTPTPSPLPESVNVDCAKCGQVLECYVNSGDNTVDLAACDVILDASLFCPNRGGAATTCGQQCRGREGVRCFTGESWGTCPAVLGSKGGTAKCKGGANGGPAALSNFASYTVTTGTTPSVSCLNDKCDSGDTCPCAAL